ncbi:MAG TPA: DnaB-like helicase C-terminal domain-containing protein [Acidocella sp.]|nr:DnaB-like helicase C-terminal domain-containing protein [Acidocella sp.]
MPDAVWDYVEKPKSHLVNEAGEQALLAALIMKPSCAQYIPASFKSEHFGAEWHAEIYEATLAVNADGAGGLLPLTTAWALGDSEKVAYLANLMNAVIGYSQGLIVSYCENITELWRRRSVIETAQRLIEECSEPSTAAGTAPILSSAISRLDAIAGAAPEGRLPTSLHDAIDQAIMAGEAAAAGTYHALSTGFQSLDKAINGFENGCLYILAARPGMGKTALATQIGINIARQGHGVLIISLEMQAVQLGRRAIAWLANVPSYVIRFGKWNGAEMERIIEAKREAKAMPFTIEDEPGQSVAMIGLRARAAKRRHGLSCLIVDHLHIVDPDNPGNRRNETWEVGKVSNDLKRLAKKLDIPVIALAQLNRGVESRDDKRPTPADLRQAGNIEQDADAIMFIYRPEYYLGKAEPERRESQTEAQYDQAVAAWRSAKERAAGRAEIICAKVREGEPCIVTLQFDGSKTSFSEIEL